MKKLILTFVGMLIASATISAQTTENTAAAVNIVTPLAITEVRSLHFGTLSVAAASGGDCVVSTSNDGSTTVPGSIGSRSKTGGINLSSSTPGYHNAAYTLSGAASTTYAITLPSTITVSCPSKPDMTISSVVALPVSSGAESVTGTLDAGGNDSFTLGGTLTVAAAQPAGLYEGTFDVTVAYN